MHLLEKFITPPSANHIALSGYLVLLTLFIHLPFLSLFLGGSLFSLFFNLLGTSEGNLTYIRFSERILKTFVFDKYLGFLFGLLPVLVLYITLSQLLYDSSLQLSNFFIPLIFILSIGLVLIYGYQFSYNFRSNQLITHIFLGLFGAIFLLVSTQVLISVLSLIINFENRFFVTSFSELVLSWNAIARYKLFLALTLGLTGVGLLLFFSDLFEAEQGLDEELRAFIRKVGIQSCTLSVLIIPVFCLWYLFTLPHVAISWKLVFFVLLFFSTLVITFLFLSRVKSGYLTRNISVLFVIFFASYSLSTTSDFISLKSSTREHSKFLSQSAQKARQTAVKAHGEPSAQSKEDLEKLGENIFTNRCSACHKYATRLVGPPFLQVLPKYKDSEDQLAPFILNPVKKDSDYPPMPSLGLTHEEADAVADYVLKRLEKEASM
jgi:cytochrome c551/c552